MTKHKACHLLQCLMTASLVILPSIATAGPWTQKEGEHQLIVNTLYYDTNEAFDTTGDKTTAAEFSKWELNPYHEYGFTDDITLGASTFMQYIRQKDAGGNAQTNTGLAETELFLRYKLWEEEGAVVSVQPLIKLPSGYVKQSPRAGRTQMDGELAVLGGYSMEWGGQYHYAAAKLAYRHRLGELSDQVRMEASLGIRPADNWLILPEYSYTARTSEDRFNPVSVSGQNNYTLSKLQLSAVYELTDQYAVQLGGFQHIAGKDTGAGGGVLLALWHSW